MLEEIGRRCDGLCSLPGCCYWRNTAPLHEDGAVAAVVSPLFSVSSGGFLLLPMADLVAAVVWPAEWSKSEEQKQGKLWWPREKGTAEREDLWRRELICG